MFTCRKIWPGERCFIIGGGPSVTLEHIRAIPPTDRVIAVNAAFRDRRDADAAIWSDDRFFKAHKDELVNFAGMRFTTRLEHQHDKYPIFKLAKSPMVKGVREFSLDPGRLGGFCSGGQAINLAYHFGVGTIVLLGFDMSGQHYHKYYTIKSTETHYRDLFLPSLQAMQEPLAIAGVRVINCSLGSKITWWKKMKFEEVVK